MNRDQNQVNPSGHNRGDLNSSNNSLLKKSGKFAAGLTSIGAIIAAIVNFLGDASQVTSFVEDHTRNEPKVETVTEGEGNNTKDKLTTEKSINVVKDGSEAASRTSNSSEIREPSTKVVKKNPPVSYIADYVEANSEEYESIVFVLSSNIKGQTDANVQSSLEESFASEDIEPIFLFNEKLTPSIASKWVSSRNIPVDDLFKYVDYKGIGTYKIEYSKASNGRDICIISLNINIRYTQNNRRKANISDDFRGNGYDKESAYQAALKQIENYQFIK